MRSYVVAVALLFIALGEPLYAQTDEVALEVAEGAPLVLECPLRVEQAAGWRLDGRVPPPELARGEAARAGGTLVARLSSPAAAPHHAGLYTCADGAARVRVSVRPRASPGTSEASATTSAAPTRAVDVVPAPVYRFELARPIKLNCTAIDGVVDGSYTWSVNGSAAEESALKGRVSLEEGGRRLVVSRAADTDHGEYACAARGAVLDSWRLEARAHAKLAPDTGVVEGQQLTLACRLIGRPLPRVAWYYKAAGAENATDVATVFGERATATMTETGARLVLASARPSDEGRYSCVPEHGVADETVVRVKDMYAALWPFLGICAEVFVLCAIILVYEKRRTKPELDDSDTDNHDQ